jgi:hypothetical protein
MLRRPAIYMSIVIAAAMGLLWLSPLSYTLRERQYRMAQKEVWRHGCSLELDLVDGDYMVGWHRDQFASDESIRQVVPTLKQLPTGFTLIGPGEGRLFRFEVGGPKVTSSGIERICELSLASLSVHGTQISDSILAQLAKQSQLTMISLNDTGLSDEALARLRSTRPKATILVNGVWVDNYLSQPRPR